MHRQWTLPALGALGLLALVLGIMLWPTPSPRQAWASGAFAVSVGSSHTCAVTASGGVKCWGFNASGQLGDGTRVDRTSPVDVAGLTSGVVAVTAGGGSDAGYHTCALTEAGGVKCWGGNYYGQLGDGTEVDRTTPVDVVGLANGVATVAAGDTGGINASHTCAVTMAGGVKCWGEGYLGTGAISSSTTPVDVCADAMCTTNLSGVAAVTLGGLYSCAMTTAGGVKCWGSGFGTTPVDVVGLTSGVTAVSAAGFHACAVTTEGGVKCWGYAGDYGNVLGDGTNTSSATPVDVLGLASGVAAVSAGLGTPTPSPLRAARSAGETVP